MKTGRELKGGVWNLFDMLYWGWPLFALALVLESVIL